MRECKWDMLLIDEEGFMQFIPQSYLNASEEEIAEKTGGCGPGKLGDWFVPDRLLGESIEPACRKHDWMYGEAENEDDKFWADLYFLVNMVLIINDGEMLDPPRLKMCMSYYIAVSFMGGDCIKGKSEGDEDGGDERSNEESS